MANQNPSQGPRWHQPEWTAGPDKELDGSNFLYPVNQFDPDQGRQPDLLRPESRFDAAPLAAANQIRSIAIKLDAVGQQIPRVHIADINERFDLLETLLKQLGYLDLVPTHGCASVHEIMMAIGSLSKMLPLGDIEAARAHFLRWHGPQGDAAGQRSSMRLVQIVSELWRPREDIHVRAYARESFRVHYEYVSRPTPQTPEEEVRLELDSAQNASIDGKFIDAEKHYTTALSFAQRLTGSGASMELAEVLYRTGRFYIFGVHGKNEDFLRGFGLLQQAVEHKHAKAMEFVADIYAASDEFGNYGRAGHFGQDYERALSLYLAAHKGGAPSSRLSLKIGDIYSFGNSTPKNPTEAAKWGQQALAQDTDDANAKYFVAERLMFGWGMPRDRGRALKLFKEIKTGKFYRHLYPGDEVISRWDKCSTAISENAEPGNYSIKDRIEIARILETDRYGDPDYPRAVTWYESIKKDAVTEDERNQGQWGINSCYHFLDKKKDPAIAAAFAAAEKAREAKDYLAAVALYEACMNLATEYLQGKHYLYYTSAWYIGILYFYGDSVPVDYARAFRFYSITVEKFHSAFDNLGWMHETGNGTVQNLACAADCYRKSAEASDPSGQLSLARILRFGIGVAVNTEEAKGWYRSVLENKDAREDHRAVATTSLEEMNALT